MKMLLIIKRLEQISYSAINGQLQTEGTYKPEGVQLKSKDFEIFR
jgi:hypothetical protein